MTGYRLSRQASSDLDEIWIYLAGQAGTEIAIQTVFAIEECCVFLGRMPRSGRARLDMGPDVRSFPLGNYLIYYRGWVHGGVLISRVLHAKRDQQAAF